MSDGSRYLNVVVEMANRFAEKDAELARLKEQLELQIHVTGSASETIENRNRLITELCDALSYFEPLNDNANLIKRAREATR